jgi:hypothetical protein
MREVVSWKSRFTLLADDNDDLSGVFKMTLTQLAQQLASLEAGIALFDKANNQFQA